MVKILRNTYVQCVRKCKVRALKFQAYKLRVLTSLMLALHQSNVHASACARVCKYVLLVDTSITALLQQSYSLYLHLFVSPGTKSCALLGYMFDKDYLWNEEDVSEDVMMILITETSLIRHWMTQYFLIHFVISSSSSVTSQVLIDVFRSISTNSLFTGLRIRLSSFGLQFRTIFKYYFQFST
jgi:hypothetical protein